MAITHSLDTDRNQQPTGARVMVCMCPQAPAAKALEAGGKLAQQLGAPWYAVYVLTSPRTWRRPSEGDADILARNIEQAKALGAAVVRVKAADVSHGLVELAVRERITHAIFGYAGRSANVLAPESTVTKFWNGVPGVEVLVARLVP